MLMIGREMERAALRAALEAARRGRGQAMIILGEPGVGKSMLLEDLAATATSAGATMLRGRAVEGAGTFRPFAEALMPRVRGQTLPASPALRPYRAALGRLIPDWATAAPAEAQLDPILVLGEGLLRLLGEIDRGGCVLLLEDLHWADPESLALFDYLSEAVTSGPVLVVASTRAPLRTPDRVVAPGATVLTLGRLTDAEVDAMIESSDRTLSESDRASIRERAEGLPLLVDELLAGAAEGAGWRVPASFAALVEQRLAVLDEQGRRMLAAAAALGSDPDWDLVPQVADVEAAATVAILREAVRLDLLVTSGPVLTWRHALTRDAVWAGLLPPERTALGRRAADVLLARGGPAQQVAAAELLIGAGDSERGAVLLLEVARRELATGAVHGAGMLLEQVAATDQRLVGLASAQVDLLTLTGRLDEALATGTGALDHVSGAEHAELCFRLARAAISLTRWAEADAFVSRARRPDDPQSLILLADSAHGAGRIGEAAELAERAVALAESRRDPSLICEAIVVQARILRLSDVDRAGVLYRHAAELAAEHGLRLWRVEALMGLGLVEMLDQERSAVFEQARDAATDLGLLVRATDMEFIVVDGVLTTEGPVAAAARSEILLERGRLLNRPLLVATADLLRGVAAAVAGDRAAVKAVLDAWPPADLPPDFAVHAYAVSAHLAIGDHDLGTAVRWLDQGVEPLLAHESVAPLHQFGLWALLRTVVGGPADDARERLRGLGVSLRRANRGALHYADAVAAGRVGGKVSAEAAYALGEEALEPVRWWNQVLRLVTLECALDDSWGDPVPQLRADLAAFEAAGYERLARVARDLLRRAGAPTRRGRGNAEVPPALRALSVTSRELDVLGLVHAGRSNAEMAEQLFLSVRTVETHVANLLAKTGAANRTELRSWYDRLTP